MQPYFFPYPGYFSLIKATNKWIVFDTPQYEIRSWMNRNRIIDPNHDGWMYFTVPVKKHKLKTPIYDIRLQNRENWKDKIIGQLGYYRKRAPYYKKVVEFLYETLKDEFDGLSELNVHTLRLTCAYLGIDFNYEIFSEMNLPIQPIRERDEWGLNICRAMGITEYINPERGQSFVHREKFLNNRINLQFLKFKFPEYDQKRKEFIPGLSIIDAMMFNTPAEINQMLDEYELVK
ncbi:MAG: WbqC family protein [Chlorobi bacterium]|nr:WbqC family protein [Chlorobiota bacterium]